MQKKAQTGRMRFEGDAEGIFIRGDLVPHLLEAVVRVRDFTPRSFDREILTALVRVLQESCDRESSELQTLRAFEMCVRDVLDDVSEV